MQVMKYLFSAYSNWQVWQMTKMSDKSLFSTKNAVLCNLLQPMPMSILINVTFDRWMWVWVALQEKGRLPCLQGAAVEASSHDTGNPRMVKTGISVDKTEL